jgi:hypothetical protein
LLGSSELLLVHLACPLVLCPKLRTVEDLFAWAINVLLPAVENTHVLSVAGSITAAMDRVMEALV